MQAGYVSSGTGNETKLRWDETISTSGEDIRKPVLGIH
jgi:hypothetical protein